MIRKIKNIFKDKDKKRLLENFLSLSILQGANYILPLITLPYLVRVLGPEKFGLLAFAQAFITYFNILVDYGFGLSATREVSIYRDNKKKLNEIYSSVTMIKFGFFILSLIIMSIIVFSFNKFRDDWLIYYLYLFGIMGGILFPVWLFQGLEKMKYITFINITTRVIFTVLVFVVIKKESDYYLVPILNLFGGLIGGIWATWIIFKTFNIKFEFPDIQRLIFDLKEGWHIFISTVAISLYTVTNTFILGLFTNNTIVGYYSAAEKLVKAVLGLLGPVSQTIYPYISRLINESIEKGILFLKKVTILIAGFSLILSIILFLFADSIIELILGKGYMESIAILKILSFLPLIIALSNIFSIQFLLNIGKSNLVSKIATKGAVLNIFMSPILIYFFSHVGAAFNILIVEIFITLQSFYYAWGIYNEISN